MNAPARDVLLMRHAHAEWPLYTGRDFDRPLTPRGLEDARAAGEALHAAGHAPDHVIVSPARRTTQTAQAVAAALALPASRIEFVPALYNASANELLAALHDHLQRHRFVMLVAHNPGISDLARELASGSRGRAFAPADWRLFTLPPPP